MVLADLPSSEGDAVARELGGATAFVPADVSVILSKSHPLGFQNALLISPIHMLLYNTHLKRHIEESNIGPVCTYMYQTQSWKI